MPSFLAEFAGICQVLTKTLHGGFLQESCQVSWQNLAGICQVLTKTLHGGFLQESCQVSWQNLAGICQVLTKTLHGGFLQESCQVSCKRLGKNTPSSTCHIPRQILTRFFSNDIGRCLQEYTKFYHGRFLHGSCQESPKDPERFLQHSCCKVCLPPDL